MNEIGIEREFFFAQIVKGFLLTKTIILIDFLDPQKPNKGRLKDCYDYSK